jgi:hypothetical protein
LRNAAGLYKSMSELFLPAFALSNMEDAAWQ